LTATADLVERAPRHLFFTGKGGVGKTSVACATAIALADRGHRVLLVSTDPASNLDEVLGATLGPTPAPIASVPNLSALNLDPEEAARSYRERMVGPYRGVLPDAALRNIEEQLSGACTVEIAAFDQFSKLLSDRSVTADYDRIVFDTAPTGHTLRLLELPAAWEGFLADNVGGASCLGPLAGLEAAKALFAATRAALTDTRATRLVLVSRAERSALAEAERTRSELAELGIEQITLVLNGLFTASDREDPVATALEERGRRALRELPAGLAALPRIELPLVPFALVGEAALRALCSASSPASPAPQAGSTAEAQPAAVTQPFSDLLPELARLEHGVILTMGKGGVGKTTVAATIAVELARRGRRVHLTTTDPAAHVEAAVPGDVVGLRITRIDPEVETRAYRDEVMKTNGAALDEAGRALLEEELRSPCTEEISVFRAFARVVDEGKREIVVIDTAPTGHTLLLLDAAEAYHREVLRTRGDAPEEVKRLLPRLRDPDFTRVILVTLAEATPVHEAAALQRDLDRAGIKPFAWVVNQSLTPLEITDPVLRERRSREAKYLAEVRALAARAALLRWGAVG
jgi:arsenite-transporting ATPase